MGILERIEQLSKNLDSIVEKAELWQLLFDECPDAIVVFHSNLSIFLANKEFCILSGYDLDELLNKKVSNFLPHRFRKVHKQYEKSFYADPQKKVNRHGVHPKLLTKAGYEIPIDIDLSFFYHAHECYFTAFIRKVDK